MTYDEAKFNNATYYDCRDSEVLRHDDPGSAIEELFDDSYQEGVPTEELIKKIGPVEVSAYERRVVTDPLALATAHVDSMLEAFEENWCEDYGNYEDDHPPWDADTLKVISYTLSVVFAEYIGKANVWQCDVVTIREYSEEEITAILKEYCPHWFEDEPCKHPVLLDCLPPVCSACGDVVEGDTDGSKAPQEAGQ